MRTCLAKIPRMKSSSKGRTSSRKQSSAGKARVISAKRKEALPRTGGVPVGRRKPVVPAPVDAPTEPPATAVATVALKKMPKKKAQSLHRKKPTVPRKKTTPAATAHEELAATALAAPEVAALAAVDTELEVEASAIVEERPVETETAPRITIGPPPIPMETRAPHRARRSLMPAIARLLSTLSRWTGVSGTK